MTLLRVLVTVATKQLRSLSFNTYNIDYTLSHYGCSCGHCYRFFHNLAKLGCPKHIRPQQQRR